MTVFEKYAERLRDIEPTRRQGRVREVIGLVAECEGMALPVGALCEIRPVGAQPVRVEVVGFRDEVVLLMPLGELYGVQRNDPVVCVSEQQSVPVSAELLGRVVDAHGRTIDSGPPITPERHAPLHRSAPHPLERARISEPLSTGIRSIDAMLTCGKGQRVGLFAGSGVGKSVLLGMIARNTSADVTVLALVGERGREVREFIEKDLGPEGLKRSVVVVETSERPALVRTKAPFAATAVAEYFRDEGRDVLLLMDSMTRMANAQREVGLSAGEPPATKGYPPSVFTFMPRLVERAGRCGRGSITAMYTVLVDADDINEPISDAARSVLDGHIWLARELAVRGHYPAVDILGSISRLMVDVTPQEQQDAAMAVRAVLATYKDAEDMINIGAYARGSNPEIDLAIRMVGPIREFLKQGMREKTTLEEAKNGILALQARARQKPDAGAAPASDAAK
ncbi:MAG: FliI/YscN family ATPase [Planctomycetota bacterium]|jgi:flagellum-specific ATP synthase